MKPRKYNLQTVLDVRERAQADAGKTLAARRMELADAEARLERCIAAVEVCRARQRAAREAMFMSATPGTEASTLVAHRTHLADLRQHEVELQLAVERQREVVRRAESEVEQALARLADAAKELQVIEKHREGWQRERVRENDRREQKLGDEVGALLYRRHKEK